MKRSLFTWGTFSLSLIILANCIPPPPELVEARKKQAEQQALQQQAQQEQAQPVTSPQEALPNPVESMAQHQPQQLPEGNDIILPAAASVAMKAIPANSYTIYPTYLVTVFLKSRNIAYNDQFAPTTQSKLAPDVKSLNMGTMFAILKENGFSTYILKNFVLEDLLFLIKQDLPFYAGLRTYCDIGRGTGTLILVSGYSDYTPGDPARGSITYQGYSFQTMKLQKFADMIGEIYIPIQDKSVLAKLQGTLQEFHLKNNISQMPEILKAVE